MDNLGDFCRLAPQHKAPWLGEFDNERTTEALDFFEKKEKKRVKKRKKVQLKLPVQCEFTKNKKKIGEKK